MWFDPLSAVLLYCCTSLWFHIDYSQVMDDYWNLMPEYQNFDLRSIEFKRVLFGFFPTYRDSPLAPGFDRWHG